MIRILLSAIMAIHAIMHILGFSKEWNLAPNKIFSGKTLFHFSEVTLKFMGILWLLACLMFIVSSAACYSKKNWLWLVASAAIFLSQTLIIVCWYDAKWGTALNVILLIVVILSAGRSSFIKRVTRENTLLIGRASEEKRIITEQMINELPAIVKTWLNRSNIIGKEQPRFVHLTQKGSLRTDPNGDWVPFDAEQYFTIDPPGFVWKAEIHASKFIDIVGRDKYENGKGSMLIKAASLIPIANSSGKEIDQGTMIRFMAEIIWFPHAAVSNYLKWAEIDSYHARISMNYNGVTASGIYTFNNDGMPIGFEAERYRELEGKFSIETWSVATRSYGIFNEIRVANTSEVTWKLKAGDFNWLTLTIIDIDYN